MLKKSMLSVFLIICISLCTLPIFASSPSESLREITQKGTLIESETVSNKNGTFRKDVYSYTKLLSSTRSNEQEYETTTSLIITPVNSLSSKGDFVVENNAHDALHLKIRYVTRAYADDYSDMTGYRLTRVIVNNQSSNIKTGLLSAMNHSAKFGFDSKEYDLSGMNAPYTVTKYPNFSNYVAKVLTAQVGAQLDYDWVSGGESNTLKAFIVNNPA